MVNFLIFIITAPNAGSFFGVFQGDIMHKMCLVFLTAKLAYGLQEFLPRMSYFPVNKVSSCMERRGEVSLHINRIAFPRKSTSVVRVMKMKQ